MVRIVKGLSHIDSTISECHSMLCQPSSPLDLVVVYRILWVPPTGIYPRPAFVAVLVFFALASHTVNAVPTPPVAADANGDPLPPGVVAVPALRKMLESNPSAESRLLLQCCSTDKKTPLR